ncbi:MAG: HpcH/HpaI aldolase family protein [Halodesulfovibrio sp.]
MLNGTLKEKLRAGKVVFGPWCVIPSAAVMNVTAAAGFDFAIIDLEHGPTSFQTAEDMARAAASAGCHPIIRLGSVHEESILKSLDIGVEGVITAHVESGEDARTAVRCCKYHPLGTRGFSPFTRAGNYSGGDIARHADIQNEKTLVGVILEGKKGIDALDDVLQTEHLDLIYIGAYDLSQALGMPGQVNHPEVRGYMESCIRKIRDAGVAAGGYVARTEADMRWMVDIGMQFITYLPDCAAIHLAFSGAVGTFKGVIGE